MAVVELEIQLSLFDTVVSAFVIMRWTTRIETPIVYETKENWTSGGLFTR
jgi:hypothetical protein